MTTAPLWLTDLLRPWVCPECDSPGSKDCDSTTLAAEQVMKELSVRTISAFECGYYKDYEILWWLQQDDAMVWGGEK